MLTENEILDEFKAAQAILKGHFILSSGLHSDTYLQCARILMNPKRGEKLCNDLAARVRTRFKDTKIDIVVSPAMGGVVVGYELASQLGVDSVFAERVDGRFTLRRGFTIPDNANVLVVEDVITTGKSSKETFDCVKEFGGKVIGEAALVDRSGGKAESELGVPLVTLLKVEVPTYEADKLPQNLKEIPAIKPGSRFLKSA